MKLTTLRKKFHHDLKELYAKDEIDSFFFLLAETYNGLQKAETILSQDKEMSPSNAYQFEAALERLKHSEPIQYIIGTTEFYNLIFKVTPATLIPRPETEELVAWILETSNEYSKVLDIGTGSGCIAISLAKHLKNTNISGLDISSEALQIAKENAVSNHVNVTFFQQDILSEGLNGSYDCIVSNPPYVRDLEKDKMHANVLNFEPHTALFVSDEDPLLFYRKIIENTKQVLANQGFLFFEINEYLSKDLVELLENEGFDKIELRKDFFEKDRMIKAIWYE